MNNRQGAEAPNLLPFHGYRAGQKSDTSTEKWARDECKDTAKVGAKDTVKDKVETECAEAAWPIVSWIIRGPQPDADNPSALTRRRCYAVRVPACGRPCPEVGSR